MDNNKGFIKIIIIVIVLVIAIYFLFAVSGDDSSTLNESNQESSSMIDSESDVAENAEKMEDVKDEGITVSSPQPNELVTLPITVTGEINGNGWFANEGEVGTVEVFDANGKSVSNLEILKATSNWLELPTSFEAIVGDRQMISYLETDTGVVVIRSQGAKDGDEVKEYRINVRFVRGQ